MCDFGFVQITERENALLKKEIDEQEYEPNQHDTQTFQSTAVKKTKYRYRNWMTVLSSKAKDTQSNYRRFILDFINKHQHRGFLGTNIIGK